MSMNKPLQIEGDDKFPVRTDEQVLVSHGYGPPSRDDDDEIDLRELLGVLLRRKWTIFLIASLVFIAALVWTMMQPPIYRASITLQMDVDQPKLLNYDVEADGGGRYVYFDDYYRTQYQILKSRALAKRTIDSMGLASVLQSEKLVTPFYTDALKQAKQWTLKTLNIAPTKPEVESDSKKVVVGGTPLENRLINSLSVSLIKNSQIVQLSYDYTNPELAASIVNAIADNYISMNLERRVSSTSFAKKFLSEQLIDVKSRLEESEANLNSYAKEKGLFKTGDEKSPSLIALRINELSAAVGQAQNERIKAQSKFERAQRAEVAASILSSGIIQALRQNLIELQGTYTEKLQIYKPGYPLMVQMKRQMNELNAEIARETNSIRSSVEGTLRSEYLTVKNNEDELRSELERQKELLITLRDKSIGYNTLLREVETSRSSYEGLLTRMKEVSVAGGVEANNISVLDPAIVPSGQFSPNTRKNASIGLLFGLVLGVVVAFLLEFLDDRVKSKDEVIRILGLPLLGAMPLSKGKDPIVHSLKTLQNPTSAVAEAFRSLRTNLLFASREGPPKVLALTSSLPGEGKSSCCINLATAFAQSSKHVLLIDADLRKPTVHKRLKLDNSVGLSNFLTGQAGTDTAIQETMIKGVSAITAGPLSPNPAELLSSERLQDLFDLVPDTFDMIILDCPPVIGLADALILANRASATVMVSAYSQSRKRSLQDANRRLNQAHANLIGFIFTKVKSGAGYGDSYEYEYYYSYGVSNLPDKNT